MALVEKGIINLDTPVDYYLKRWQLPDAGFDNNKVTVRRLLNHTSGLSIYPMSASINGYLPDEKLPSLHEVLSKSYNGYGKLRLIQNPGSGFQYNNGNYLILQLLIEDVTGHSFSDYLQQKIFKPLSMVNTGCAWNKEIADNIATPYNQEGESWPHFQYVEEASGGIYTTITDLTKFVAAMDSSDGNPPGRGVLKPETIHLMISPAEETGNQYGLGYQIATLKKYGYFASHHGSNEGFNALFLMDTKKRAGVVIMTNSDSGGRVVGEIVCEWAKWAGIELSEPCP